MDIQILDLSRNSVTLSIDGVQSTNGNKSHSSRRVFLFDGFVVKFDNTRQNECERDFYLKRLEAKDAKYFPAFLGYGECVDSCGDKWTFLVQERLEMVQRNATRRDKQLLDALIRKYDLNDLILHTSDSDHHNVAMTEKRFKIFDIGYYWHLDEYLVNGKPVF